MSVAKTSPIAKQRDPSRSVATADASTAVVPPNSAYVRVKAVLDGALAALLLAPGLPIIALMVLAVRLTSRGPGIFRQVRVGRGGRKFTMYKVRTMRIDAEAATGPVWTQAGDPRVTLVGSVLRRFHLDELPQLFNVLRGEMALVGPRPERPEFVRVLAEAIPGYLDRLAVRPGVTGLAQLNLPPDSDLHSVRRKLTLDRQYVREMGLWLDFRIVAGTFLRLFKLPERWVIAGLGLRRKTTTSAINAEASFSGGANGADLEHSPGTPVSVLIQAAGDSCPGDGNPARHHAGRGKRRHRHLRRSKPR